MGAGVIICEGLEEDAAEFVHRLKQLRWKVIPDAALPINPKRLMRMPCVQHGTVHCFTFEFETTSRAPVHVLSCHVMTLCVRSLSLLCIAGTQIVRFLSCGCGICMLSVHATAMSLHGICPLLGNHQNG